MSEGPEYRLTVDFLRKKMVGKKIISFIFCGSSYTDKYPEGYEIFDKSLPLKVLSIDCKGKIILFTFKKNYILHSMMKSGNWQKNYDDYCKWFIELDDNTTIWFRDKTVQGTLFFTTKKLIVDSKLLSLGPDIMTSEFKLPLFKKLSKKHYKKNVTSFLTDQSIISGCGDYIKAESLYYAGVSPLRKIGELKDRELEMLYEGLRIISRVSYNKKGLSINDNNRIGFFKEDLKIFKKKFARKVKTADGKITYWDPCKQV